MCDFVTDYLLGAFSVVSGEPPQEPVFSPKSGHVFERRLIEKYLDDHRKCPITDEPLSFDELIPVKSKFCLKLT